MNISSLSIPIIYMFSVIFFGIILGRSNFLPKEITRKIIHLGVSFWWFTLLFVSNMFLALILPVSFIILNSLVTYKKDLAIKLGFSDKRERNYGLISFPIAIVLLIILYYTGVILFDIAAISMLILGFSDSLAALSGLYLKPRVKIFNFNKTIFGSLAVLLSSIIVMTLYFNFIGSDFSNIKTIIIILSTAIVATLSELLFEKGFDNISIVLFTSLWLRMLW